MSATNKIPKTVDHRLAGVEKNKTEKFIAGCFVAKDVGPRNSPCPTSFPFVPIRQKKEEPSIQMRFIALAETLLFCSALKMNFIDMFTLPLMTNLVHQQQAVYCVRPCLHSRRIHLKTTP